MKRTWCLILLAGCSNTVGPSHLAPGTSAVSAVSVVPGGATVEATGIAYLDSDRSVCLILDRGFMFNPVTYIRFHPPAASGFIAAAYGLVPGAEPSTDGAVSTFATNIVTRAGPPGTLTIATSGASQVDGHFTFTGARDSSGVRVDSIVVTGSFIATTPGPGHASCF